MGEDIKIYPREIEHRAESLIADEMRKSQERNALLIASAFEGVRTHLQDMERRLSARFDSIDSELDLSAEPIHEALREMAWLPQAGPLS